MSYRIPKFITALAFATLIAGKAQAQTDHMHLGPRLSYQFDLQKFGVGAQFSTPIARHLEFYPSFDYFFVSGGSFVSLNADLKYRFAAESIKWLYAGGGLNIAHASAGGHGDTHAGLNLLGGVESLKGQIHPFGEFRVILGNGSTAQISAGLNITLGKH